MLSIIRTTALAIASLGLFALAAPASAQLLQQKSLSSGIALAMAETTMAVCKANGYAVSVTVVGRSGEIILQVRGDNTGPHTVENSMRKAYTARTFRVPSGEIVTAMIGVRARPVSASRSRRIMSGLGAILPSGARSASWRSASHRPRCCSADLSSAANPGVLGSGRHFAIAA